MVNLGPLYRLFLEGSQGNPGNIVGWQHAGRGKSQGALGFFLTCPWAQS